MLVTFVKLIQTLQLPYISLSQATSQQHSRCFPLFCTTSSLFAHTRVPVVSVSQVTMHVSNHVRLLHKRQNGEPPPLPTAPGLGGGATASNDLGSAATSLIVNQNSAELPAVATSAPALV